MTPEEIGTEAAAKVLKESDHGDIHPIAWMAISEAVAAAVKATRDEFLNEKARKELGVGATGKYPEGSLGEGDDGELKAALVVREGRMFLLFGKPVSWLSFTKSEAMTWANGLLEKAEKMP